MEKASYQAILVITEIYGNFDANTCIDQTNNGGRHSNEVRVAPIASSSEAKRCTTVSVGLLKGDCFCSVLSNYFD